MTRATRLRRVAIAIALIAAAFALHRARSRYVDSWRDPAPPGAAPPLHASRAPGLSVAPKVRVVLLDGLELARARELPALGAACASGVDLTVDVGFPTLSLPVQRALFTGLTSQQSGAPARNDPIVPPLDAIPARVPGSIAIAEAHPEIAASFGFARAIPEVDPAAEPRAAIDPTWRGSGFARAAIDHAGGNARLVFVHVLRIDEAGHAHGGASREYVDAARSADALVAELLAAAPDARWFVLSDHGHRPRGGHGDAEPSVRLVRACIVGGVEPMRGAAHWIDVSRALADSLGVPLADGAVGRPLAAAIADPRIGVTLPATDGWRWIAAAIALVGGLFATSWAARDRVRGLLHQPLWWPIAFASLLIQQGAPTISNRIVWAPEPARIVLALLPGLILCAAFATLALVRGASLVRVIVGQLALPAALAVGALLLAGVPGGPPVAPFWSGRASAFAILVVAATATLSIPFLVGACLRGPGPARRDPPPSDSVEPRGIG